MNYCSNCWDDSYYELHGEVNRLYNGDDLVFIEIYILNSQYYFANADYFPKGQY